MSGKKLLTPLPPWLRACIYALLLGLACMLLTPLSAAACGGLFSADSYTEQSAERLIFAVDPGQVTLYEQINYTGSPKDFAWVLPVPAVPKVDTVPINLFSDLDRETAPLFSLSGYETPDCFLIGMVGAPAPMSNSSVNLYSSGAVGPYSYDVIGSSNPQALTQWLNGHHYKIPTGSQAEMQPYIAAHMLFLAVRLQGSAGVQDMQPVKITYASSQQEISIPLRMATPMSNSPLGVLVWVFGSSRYAPQNYRSVEFTNSDFGNISDPRSNFYSEKVDQAVNQAHGHAFITEYAQPTTNLYARDQLLQTLKQHYSYLTRMFTRMRPSQINLDPTFAAQKGLPDVSSFHIISNPNSSANSCIGQYVLIGGVLLIATVVIVFVRRRIRLSAK
jgi:hypothetical protein